MKRITRVERPEYPVIVFGCGKRGKGCTEKLKSKDVVIKGFCDNDEQKWGTSCCGYAVYSPDEVNKMQDISIVISTIHFHTIMKQIQDEKWNKDVLIFYDDEIYRICSDEKLLGCTNKEQFIKQINAKNVCLRGNYKHREDFKYVFSEIEIQCEQELEDELLADAFYILCEENDDLKNMQHEADYLYVKDLLCLLDEEYIESAHKIPSLMFEKTYNAPMVEQRLCVRPFFHAQIDSGMNFKFCCGDWSESVGNILEDAPQTIWKSVIAKIFRLSLINKTYCFCYAHACDYLVPNPAPANDRMHPIPVVKEIPDSFEIGIDKTCNLFCKSCRDCVVVEQGERKELIEKAKENIIASGWLEQVQRTLYGGQGEVFFSKVYRDLIYDTTVKRKTLDLRTNGTLLDETEFEKLKEKYEELKIYVSIDAYYKETYDKLRRNHNPNTFERLQKNLLMLSEKRKRGELAYFQINMCVQHENYHEIPQFINWGDELGVDMVYLSAIRNWGTYTDEEFEKIRVLNDNKKLKPEVKAVIDTVTVKENKVAFGFEI